MWSLRDNRNPVVPKGNWDSTFPDMGKTGKMSGKYEGNNSDQKEIKKISNVHLKINQK